MRDDKEAVRLVDMIQARARQEGRDQVLSTLEKFIAQFRPAATAPLAFQLRLRRVSSTGNPKAIDATKPARKKKRKNPWAGLTPTERLNRVNAIRKGKGLPPRKVSA